MWNHPGPNMRTALDKLLEERRLWRENRRRRIAKVSERCALGWKNFCEELHREIVRHNTLGKRPPLGLRYIDNALQVHRLGQLTPLLTFSLDEENAQISYRSPFHMDSVILEHEGTISAAFLGSLLISAPNGCLTKFGYSEAARYMLLPALQN